ncbi:MAG: hypothetical protein V4677_14775 [Bacteroidota bacterium]
MEQKNISADKQTADKPNRDISYYVVRSIKIVLLLAILQVSLISIADIADHYDITTFEYPIIHPYFVWALFFLPLIGVGLLFTKINLYRLLGAFLIIVSVWDIYLFLQQTAGAL